MMRAILGILAAGLVLLPVAASADGKAVYTADCAACHDNMAPKLGDKNAWAPYVKQGVEAMAAATEKGTKAMPPRGGNPGLSDGDIKAAVEYIVSKSK